MLYLNTFVSHVLRKPSLYFFAVLIIFTVDRHRRYEDNKSPTGTFYSDVQEYYRFLPDIFIRGARASEPDLKQNRRTIGMAILYAPAFALGHAVAKLSGGPADGYSQPYQWSIRWGSIIYCLVGLFFCRKSLLLFFSEEVSCIALACILFGTNLFYYTYSWGEMPHSYLFCLNAVFIFCCLRWLREHKSHYLLFAALLAGMVTLIRPTGIVVLLFPLLFDVRSLQDFSARLRRIFKNIPAVAGAALLFFLPLLAQMLFWKSHVGQYVYYSYGRERFFFNDPQIVNFLVSYRKGWLVYTPIMVFALAGMLLSYRHNRPFFLFNIIFLTVNVYVLSSWWEWSFGGSFGCRALVESYAFFIFPFATFVSWFWNNRFSGVFLKQSVRLVPLLVFYLLVQLNLIQASQFRAGILHWSGMNKETYWLIFLREDMSKEEVISVNSKLSLPDAEKMLKGERDL